MIREKLTWYLKALPKAWRNRLTPVPEVVTAFLEACDDARRRDARTWTEALRVVLHRAPRAVDTCRRLGGCVDAGASADEHARRRCERHRTRARARPRAYCARSWARRRSSRLPPVGPAFERSGIRRWDFGDLPESLAFVRDGRSVTGYPTLVDEGESVALKLYDTKAAAEAATRAAVVRLIRIELKDAVRRWEEEPPGIRRHRAAAAAGDGGGRAVADVIAAACARAFLGDDPLPRSASAFAEQVKRARARLPAVAEGAFRLLAAIATEYHALSQQIAALPTCAFALRRRTRRAARRAGLRRILLATPWAAAQPFAALSAGVAAAADQGAGQPGQDAKHGQAVAALWERYRARAEANRSAQRHRAGAGCLPVAARGTQGVALRPGAADRPARFLQAPGKGLGGAFPRIRGDYSRWQPETTRDTVTYALTGPKCGPGTLAGGRGVRMAGKGPKA